MINKIAIHSAPRSGSTWLGEIFNSSETVKYCFQPLFSYSLKNYLNENSTLENVNNFYHLLLTTDDEFINQNQQRINGTLPNFKKTNYSHVCYKEVRYHHLVKHLCNIDPELKFILLIRNPLEVINSWISAPREFDTNWKVDEEILLATKKNRGKPEEFYGLKAWIDSSMLFECLSKKHPNQVKLVNYLDLKSNPLLTTKDIFGFCELETSNQTIDFIELSTTKYVEGTYSVFKDKKNIKENHLSENNIKLIIETVTQHGLEKYLS